MHAGQGRQCSPTTLLDFPPLLRHGLLDISCFLDHTVHLLVFFLTFAFASACSLWNIFPFPCLANSYSSVNTLLKYHLLLEVFLTLPSASSPLAKQILLISVLFSSSFDPQSLTEPHPHWPGIDRGESEPASTLEDLLYGTECVVLALAICFIWGYLFPASRGPALATCVFASPA